MQKNAKKMLGFTGDYITIFKGKTYPFKDWLKEQGARYNPKWGWYFETDAKVPEDLPADILPIKLLWSQVSADGKNLNNDDTIKEFLESILYDPTPSEYQGNIGEKISVNVRVEKVIPLNGYYGCSNMHIMSDENANIYVWTTTTRSWEEGSFHSITGTVKDHRIYRNCKQTILSRCKDVNEKKVKGA